MSNDCHPERYKLMDCPNPIAVLHAAPIIRYGDLAVLHWYGWYIIIGK